MTKFGMAVNQTLGGTRLELQCPHQSGLIYVVEGEASWVCAEELRHVHALCGFLTELAGLEDPRVQVLMQRWGLYFRARPLEADPGAPVTPADGAGGG